MKLRLVFSFALVFIIISIEGVKRSGGEVRKRRDYKGKRAQLVKKLMKSPKTKEGAVRLIDGSNEYEG